MLMKAKKQKGGERSSVTERNLAAQTQPAGESPDATDAIIASPKQKRGDQADAAETDFAPRKQRRTKNAKLTTGLLSGKASDDPCPDTALGGVARTNTADGEVRTDTESASAICQQLRELQRRRAGALKSRIMIENRLVALVAQECGYSSGLDEKERKQRFDEARKVIKQIESGDDPNPDSVERRVSALVQSNLQSASGFDAYVSTCEKEMVKLAKQLPIAAWVEQPEQNGFGLKSLAIIIGECGDLNNYANPAKLWKRMGCAPFKGKMPSTWRSSKPSLTALEWTELGYSPWRRSVAWVIGDCLMKGNKTGPYRQRYDEAKAAAKVSHPDWTDGHAHNHALLLCVKRLLRDLWAEWRR